MSLPTPEHVPGHNSKNHLSANYPILRRVGRRRTGMMVFSHPVSVRVVRERGSLRPAMYHFSYYERIYDRL